MRTTTVACDRCGTTIQGGHSILEVKAGEWRPSMTNRSICARTVPIDLTIGSNGTPDGPGSPGRAVPKEGDSDRQNRHLKACGPGTWLHLLSNAHPSELRPCFGDATDRAASPFRGVGLPCRGLEHVALSQEVGRCT